ncbi:MAG: transcription-repair coupling factor [Desulfobacterales bacterium]|nr:transcription-repair coupling factor [Desulfobacterales bacterium]
MFFKLFEYISSNNKINCTGLSGAEIAFFISQVHKSIKVPIVIISSNPKDSEKILGDLTFFGSKYNLSPIYFPSYEFASSKFLFTHDSISKKRISALYDLIENPYPQIICITIQALLQKLIPKNELTKFVEPVMSQEEIDRDTLLEKLVSSGYNRSVIVEEPGEFSVRGGIVDIFSPQYDEPIRIEMFGDFVESIRFFSPLTQRTSQSIKEAVILPASEAILKMANIEAFIANIRHQAGIQGISSHNLKGFIERIKSEGIFQGLETLLSLIYPSLDTFFDYIGDKAIFIEIEPKNLEFCANEFTESAIKNYADATNENRICVEPDKSYLTWSNINQILSNKKRLTIRMLKSSDNEELSFHFNIKDNSFIHAELKNHKYHLEHNKLLLPLANWIINEKQQKRIVFIVCSTQSQGDRVRSLLTPYGINIGTLEKFPEEMREHGLVYIILGHISSGFVWEDESISIITEDEIFGQKQHRREKRKKSSVKETLLSLDDLKQDDLIVHVDHGIGKYKGLIKLKIDGITNDYLLLSYKDEDKLYLPVDRMNMVQKYIGVEGLTPDLDKMGGKSWDKTKERAKKAAEKIAGELLELYAARKIKEGHTFGEVDSYFHDFEAGFPYEETPDQLKAIEDVISDMQNTTPMDRLICGDVGYGKTEVALRASFIAANEGKQVAILVPTTLLAEQHFTNFSNRFEKYPFVIKCLNRFRSSSEQRTIIDDLASGKIDIAIGTHRLIQKDVKFKDLGLLIIDEEQRFGVKHKERLKKFKTTVDVLTLTATPIPRTLHMSLVGIRDISVIATPPEERRSIISYICEFDDAIISEGIRKELKRGGQIYFVHNNINSITKIAERLKKVVPEIKLGIAHGQLDEEELEDIMMKFLKKEIDMLVCTTIIESGIDIPSVNTIFINRADRFGLSQIYQLRGRVGRSSEQAYAYLLVPNEAIITSDAQKRLKVLMEHSDLGSGFQIAMNDLRIRGGGSILSSSQSGHIAAIGYDMFLQLMENAVSELKGEKTTENLEPEINIGISAFIPESYITDIDERLLIYRRLSKLKDNKDISEIKEELIDRYGELPVEANNLLLKILFRILCIKAGIKKIDLTPSQVLLYAAESHQKNPFAVVDMVLSEPNKFQITPNHVICAKISQGNLNIQLAQVKNILKDITQRVNGINIS